MVIHCKICEKAIGTGERYNYVGDQEYAHTDCFIADITKHSEIEE